MASLNDFRTMQSWGSPDVPMFSQGGSTSLVPETPQLFSSPVQPTDWTAAQIPAANGNFPLAGLPQAAGTSWMDNIKDAFGTTQSPGWATAALGAGQGLLNGWLGMQQYGLAKDKLAEGKRQFELNYNAQRTMTNADLEDRQKARVASNPGAYESVGSYMAKNGVKGLA
jgi:hypothetical protein